MGMTSRERWMAALRCEPVDRLPFWPKLDAAYPLHQKEPFRSMANAELHAWIGSDQHVGGPSCLKSTRKTTRIEHEEKGDLRIARFHTPRGTLTRVDRFDAVSMSHHPIEFPVKCADDIETMALWFADERVEFDPDGCERAAKLIGELGEKGAAITGVGISPLMDWLQHLAGIENGHYLLADHRECVEALFDAMHRGLCRCAEIIAEKSPFQIVYSTENTSTTLISPNMFRRYCMKHLSEYGRIITGAGKIHVLHMCGHLKRLLPDLDTLPAGAFEAFTSPPVGNTTLLDGRLACARKCLIGGTNATLWLEDAGTIATTIEHDLDVLPHRWGVVVTSAGVMPPRCRPETIKQVGERVRAYVVG
jgi:uroporphyrinogen-III decarboxylase